MATRKIASQLKIGNFYAADKGSIKTVYFIYKNKIKKSGQIYV
ncbi:MAG: hypothetical protein ACTSYA_07070 [Candidatus Kariarchaeaceae archaeon]